VCRSHGLSELPRSLQGMYMCRKGPSVQGCHPADLLLQVACPARKLLREAVYSYWLAKRKRRGAPLLRSLQAPTSTSDNNPYNVFRCAQCGGSQTGQHNGSV